MSKKSPTQTSIYEILYIIPNKFSDEELAPIQEKVNSVITANNGEVKKTHFWGKKRLSYPIKQTSFGYYTLLECEIPGSDLQEIDRSLRIMPELLRHITVKIVESKKKTHTQRHRPESKKDEKPETPTFKQETLKKELPKKKDAEKMDLKDLDESLDKLLNVDNLL